MPHIGIDAPGSDAGNIPITTPVVFGYVTGSWGIQWSAADFARFGHSALGRINQDNNPDPHVGTIFDLESGAGTFDGAVQWCRRKQAAGGVGVVYLSDSNVSQLEQDLANGGVDKYGLWIANWNLNESEATQRLTGRTLAVQWASPSSNPNLLVPGSHLTIAQANVDLSVVADSWLSPPASHPRPSGIANATLHCDLASGRFEVHSAPGEVWLGGSDEWLRATVAVDRRTGHWRIADLPPQP